MEIFYRFPEHFGRIFDAFTRMDLQTFWLCSRYVFRETGEVFEITPSRYGAAAVSIDFAPLSVDFRAVLQWAGPGRQASCRTLLRSGPHNIFWAIFTESHFFDDLRGWLAMGLHFLRLFWLECNAAGGG